jgi:hypothetical protein
MYLKYILASQQRNHLTLKLLDFHLFELCSVLLIITVRSKISYVYHFLFALKNQSAIRYGRLQKEFISQRCIEVMPRLARILKHLI